MNKGGNGLAHRVIVLSLALVAGLAPLPAAPAAAQGQGAGQAPAQGRPEFVEDELLVLFKRQVPAAAQATAHANANARVVREVRGLDVKVVQVPPARLANALQRYQQDPTVEYAEMNPVAYPDGMPNDASFGQQWALHNTGQNGGRADADIDAPAAWDVPAPAGATPATISIVDTGIDAGHPDLAGKVVEQRNWYDGGGTADVYNHGTHVAGIAAAATGNGIGIAGVCPECTVINAKVCSDAGGCPHDRIANGVLWSVGCEERLPDPPGGLGECVGANRSQVINMSLSSTAGSTTLQRALDRAAQRGATMACAAGNNGNSRATYPASYAACIAVAGTTSQDGKYRLSTTGTWVSVAAPADPILSTVPGGGYATKSGTSMASPHVAGLAGLLRSRGVATTRDAVRGRIESTADRIAGTGRDWSNGRINACRAMTGAGTC